MYISGSVYCITFENFNVHILKLRWCLWLIDYCMHFYIASGYEIIWSAVVWSCVHDLTCWLWEEIWCLLQQQSILLFHLVIYGLELWCILIHFQISMNYMALHLKPIYLLKSFFVNLKTVYVYARHRHRGVEWIDGMCDKNLNKSHTNTLVPAHDFIFQFSMSSLMDYEAFSKMKMAAHATAVRAHAAIVCQGSGIGVWMHDHVSIHQFPHSIVPLR